MKTITSTFFQHLKREASKGDIKISLGIVDKRPYVHILDCEIEDADKALNYLAFELSKVVEER